LQPATCNFFAVKKKSLNENRKVERPSGLLAIVISFLIIASILTQLDVKPDYSNILDDISLLNENIFRLRLNAFIWLANSVFIIFLGPLILITFLPHGRSSSYLAAFLVSATGIIYLLYTATCFNIISIISEYSSLPDNESSILPSLAFSMLINKINLQLIGYTLTGISAFILGLLIVRTGYLPRIIGIMSIAGGLVYAVYGWLDSENLVFAAGRVLFVLSLMLFGSYLLLRGTKNKKLEKVIPPSN